MEDTKSHEMVYHSCTDVRGALHGIPLNAQYPALGLVDRRRLNARKNNTTYCYDFPLVSFPSNSHKKAAYAESYVEFYLPVISL